MKTEYVVAADRSGRGQNRRLDEADTRIFSWTGNKAVVTKSVI